MTAQPLLFIPSDSVMATSVDSLRIGIEELTKEREELIEELRLLSSQVRTVERSFNRQFSDLQLRHETLNRNLDIQFDTLRAQIPDEEPLRTATFYIRYLNQRQDSLIAYVERLESELDNIPDKHYWGVRNDFKEFDHLLLFTFLGAIMSLGLVLLLRGDNKREQTDSTDQLTAYLAQEDHVDRLSMSITLLVGSILVLLFIIFIL
ncbi:MAG: hypothetical protein KTR29_21630 [Rhodothermaceae bacterium]|nr:hypothetical protein [Rhodothermaceae bacterium]